MKKILTVDIGTSKICAGIFDCGMGKFAAVESCANGSDVLGLPSEYNEQDPERIVNAVFGLIKKMRYDNQDVLKSVDAVSVSGQMHGVLLVDSMGLPVTNLITWRDRRALEIEDLLAVCNTNDDFKITGTHLHCGYGGATLAWLSGRRMIPAACCALSMADYLVYCLTGIKASEETHAASWGIFDLRKGDWHYSLIEKLGIDKTVLPPLYPSASLLKCIKPEVADEFGLASDTPVCSPVGDNQASVIGVTGFDMSGMIANLGTGGQVSIPQKGYEVIDGFETRPMPNGGSILVGASLCGGWSYAYMCNFVRNIIKQVADVEMTNGAVYKKLDQLAAEADSECGGLAIDTRFAGIRSNDCLRGSVCNIDTDNFTVANMARAFMVGMVKELAELASRADLSGIEKVYACGNGVKMNPLMPGIIADIFSKSVEISMISEEAAIGAALAAAQKVNKSHAWHLRANNNNCRKKDKK